MRFTLPLIALAAIAAPVAAAPQASEEIITVAIAYADIDLTTAEGRAQLEQRVEARLREACTTESSSRYNYGRPTLDAKCVSDARAAALAEVERLAAAETRSGREVSAN